MFEVNRNTRAFIENLKYEYKVLQLDGQQLPVLDIHALREAVKWAETEYEKRKFGEDYEWFQGDWAVQLNQSGTHCRTGCCIAGHVVTQAGGQFYFGKNNELAGTSEVLMPDDPELRDIPTEAKALLGLTEYEAGCLFKGGNGIADIRALAEVIAQSRGFYL